MPSSISNRASSARSLGRMRSLTVNRGGGHATGAGAGTPGEVGRVLTR
jgi:hypothetical protein